MPVTAAELAGRTLPCPCGVRHTIPTQEVHVAAGALPEVAACCRRLLPGTQALLVADAQTYAAAGARVESALAAAGYRVEVCLLPPDADGKVRADDARLAFLRRALRPAHDFLVAVGAGTVNDVAKLASFQARRPYLACATAASVNGYTSGIAAFLRRGVKRTLPARPPVAVVADLEVLAAAPPALRRAGLGDLLSKPVCHADWRLSHLLKGGYYCETPLQLVSAAEQACRAHAAAIGRGDLQAVGLLAEALLLSGFSMVVAGSSSPASGGEHLLSHYWDMTARYHGRREQLHGAQVGVATLVTATLYEKLRQLGPQAIDLARLRRHYPEWPQREQALRAVHGPLAAAIIPEARKKYLPLAAKEREWHFILEHWEAIWQALSPLLVPAAALRAVLRAAGAPTTVHELGISAEELRHAFLYAKDIRGRYTVLDFADDLGLLEPLCAEVLRDSGVLETSP